MNREQMQWMKDVAKKASTGWASIKCHDHIEIYDADGLLVCWLPVVTRQTIHNAEFICLAREMIDGLMEGKK